MPSKKKTAHMRKRSRPVEPKKTNMNMKILGIAIIAFIIIIAFVIISLNSNEDSNKNDNGTSTIDNPIAIMDTSMGIIKLELYKDKAPITATNFIDLSNQDYYDGVIFHRVMNDFMIQGGDPAGTGLNGHAAKYHEGYGNPNNPDTWVIPDEFHDDLKHDSAGILSMANAGANTGGSQFFITVKETPWLDGKHSVFGKVIEGLDVVISISELDPEQTDERNKPFEDVVINDITIEE